MFISEFAETSIRGSLGTCFQLFLTVGILFVFCVGAVVNWVQLSWLCLVFPVLNFVGLFFVPESPIWLLKQVSLILTNVQMMTASIDTSIDHFPSARTYPTHLASRR